MTLEELIAQTRKQADDATVSPQLWDDDDIALYLNEALDDACIRAKLIYDKISAKTLVTITACPVTPDTPTGFNYLYRLDPAIFLIDSAEYVDTKLPLTPIPKDEYAQRRSRRRYGDGYGSNGIFGDYSAAGRATNYWPQINPDESISLRLLQSPMTNVYTDANGDEQPIQIRLGVYRTPYDPMEAGDEPEINRRHHLNLIDGACARMLMRRDKDAVAPGKVSEFEARFTQAFGPPVNANTIRQQREFRRHRTTFRFPG